MKTKFYRSKILLLVSFLVLIGSISCKKTQSIPDETPPDKLKADAVFNNSILEGSGNLFYHTNLNPDSKAQLVTTLAYKSDSVAFFGKTNASGQVENIHTTVISSPDGLRQTVMEKSFENSVIRTYTVENKIKSKFMLELEAMSRTELLISIKAYDKDLKAYKTIASSYLKNGLEVQRSALAPKLLSSNGPIGNTTAMGNTQILWDCNAPTLSDDLDRTIDSHLNYFACGGLNWDVHTVPSLIKKGITGTISLSKKALSLAEDEELLSKLESAHEKASATITAIKEKIKEYKFEKTLAGKTLKFLENLLKAEDKAVELTIIPQLNESDLDFDEVTEKSLYLKLQVRNKATNEIFTQEPVYINIQFLPLNGTTPFYTKLIVSNSSTATALLEIEPQSIAALKENNAFRIRYALQFNNTISGIVNAKIGFIKPKIVYTNLDTPPEVIPMVEGVEKAFRLVDQQGRDFNARYSDVAIYNVSNPKLAVSVSAAASSFSLKVSSMEKTLQQTTLSVVYKGDFVKQISLVINDSTAYYTKLIPGNWMMKWTDPGFPLQNGQEDKFNLKADGSGTYYWMKPTGLAGYFIKETESVYHVKWSVTHSIKGYFLNISYPGRGWSSSSKISLNPSLQVGEKSTVGPYFIGTKE